MPSRDKDSYSIQSVENALDVLEALCEEEDEVRISRLSEKLRMNKTSVFRLLATFESRGYVEKEKSSGKYRLGLSAYEIGQKLLSRMNLLKQARPVMERLARDFDEAIYVTVRRDNEVLFLDMADTTQQVKIISLVGKRFPLAETAQGRVILAFTSNLDTETSEALIARDRLIDIQRQGFSYGADELGEGIASIAVPLFGIGGELNGCLCVVGPEFRISRDIACDQMLKALQETSEIISSKLGCHNRYISHDPI